MIRSGQWTDVQKEFPEVKKEDCLLLLENGDDKTTHFSGTFFVNIKRRGLYCFQDGSLMVFY